MAVLDATRDTVRLTATELAAASLGLADPGDPGLRHPEMQEALRAVGGCGPAADRLAPAVARVVQVVLRPQLRLVVEVCRATAAVAATVWATPELAVVGRPGDGDSVEYAPADPVSLPFTLASLVGLGRGRPVGGRAPVVCRAGALDDAGAAVSHGATTTVPSGSSPPRA